MQTRQRYSAVAIWLHWLIALTLALQLGLGFAMPEGAAGFAAIQFHKSIGIAVFALTAIRIAWRLALKPPAMAEEGWQAKLAALVHVALYAFMILAPLTGWIMVSTAPVGIPTVLFGTLPWPHLPLPAALFEPAEAAHEILAYLGLALVGLHVAGALRHHVLLRDETIARIAPGGSANTALAMLAAALLLFAAPFLAFRSLAGDEEEPLATAAHTVPSPAAAEQLVGSSTTPSPSSSPSETPSPTPTPTASETPEQPAAAPHWSVRPGGRLRFSIANGDSRINGRFERWSGDIAMDPDSPDSAQISIEVDLSSATVGDAQQDSVLAGPDFLGPSGTATWRSNSVRSTGNGRYAASGQLILKGRTRAVPITFTLGGSGATRTVSGRATVDRTAFGVGSGEMAQSLAPDVTLEFNFEAARQ